MKRIYGGLLLVLLAGCSESTGSSPAVSQLGGSHSSPAAVSKVSADKVVPQREVHPHNHAIRIHGKGGVIDYTPVKTYDVTLPYAPNSLGKRGVVTGYIGWAAGWLGTSFPNAAPNYTLDWEGYFALNDQPITFDNGQLTMMISGSGLNPQNSYALFVYTAVDRGSFNLFSQTAIGTPVKGTLSMPSVFENGFTAPQGWTVLALEHQD